MPSDPTALSYLEAHRDRDHIVPDLFLSFSVLLSLPTKGYASPTVRQANKFDSLPSVLFFLLRSFLITVCTVCREFIQALEQCHVSTWSRLTGGCNQQKDSLNKCLRKEASCPLQTFVPERTDRCARG
jgi:hypothetical protein